MKYIVSNICSFMNKGKLYKAGDEISSSAFLYEEDFNAAIKEGKILEVKDEEEKKASEKASKKTSKKAEKSEEENAGGENAGDEGKSE